MAFFSQVFRRILGESFESIDRRALNLGRILAKQNEGLQSSNIQDFGFGIFSQWDEDGIIQELARSVPPEAHTFIEIGVEDFKESNTRFLMMKDNWRGFIVDASSRNMAVVKKSDYYWKFDLQSKAAFVCAENVNDLVLDSGFGENLGLLSVDIDGVDFHILNAIKDRRPHILVVEYNANFGPTEFVTVPYRPDFLRSKAHYSNLYYGASLGAIAVAAERMGLFLVGTNSAGNNAFFVREENTTAAHFRKTVQDAFTASRFREARNSRGLLTFDVQDGLQKIAHLPLERVDNPKRNL